MKDYFKDIISPAELAEFTGKKYRWVMTLMPELEKKGLAKRIGKPFICHVSAVDYIESRPETRGRKKIH